ncbi:MAG: radical SAM protein [Chitinispirillaceae bacterium]|jgi:MoaA/NifB/PqqE/SkfB family radical SAM enzyme
MKPLLLHYYVTTRCNARCVFCDIWKEPAIPDALCKDVKTNLAAARRAGCRFVDFTGGEPLLNQQLPEFLHSAKEMGFITSVTTNCLLFPERVKELACLIDLLHFSISADTQEFHDVQKGSPSFNSVLQSIDIALRNKLVPDLLFTYTERNISSFEGVFWLAREKKLIVILDPEFAINGKDPISNTTHRKALEYSKRPGVYLNRAHLTFRSGGGNHTSSPLCHAVDSTLVILPDNTLALPCFHHRIDMIPVGKNLSEILSGSVRQESARMQGCYQFCEQCHINCYFDPSYSYLRNRLFVQSIAAKFRYSWQKYIIYRRPFPYITHNVIPAICGNVMNP